MASFGTSISKSLNLPGTLKVMAGCEADFTLLRPLGPSQVAEGDLPIDDLLQGF